MKTLGSMPNEVFAMVYERCDRPTRRRLEQTSTRTRWRCRNTDHPLLAAGYFTIRQTLARSICSVQVIDDSTAEVALSLRRSCTAWICYALGRCGHTIHLGKFWGNDSHIQWKINGRYWLHWPAIHRNLILAPKCRLARTVCDIVSSSNLRAKDEVHVAN